MHRIRVNVHKNYLDHLFWAFYYLGTQYTKLSIFPHKETFFFYVIYLKEFQRLV